ncbi:MAG TPA: hypothetical protein VK327_01570 [Candidatus Paceibacterota bacterium]|nr:hypothetical protein [Candidatus Paceibacterota bacterium]
MNYRTIGIILASVALLNAGCISHTETVYRDVERTRVEFESDAAARLFYETLSKRGSVNHAESTTHVELPIVFSHERHVVPGRNAEFNEAVAICDSNRDGRITETEARIYANQK